MNGGIAGYATGSTISNCYNEGEVTAWGYQSGFTSNYTGGILGYGAQETVNNCYNTAAISGSSDIAGIVGYNFSVKISNCYNTGSITSSKNGYGSGGIAGECNSSDDSISYSYNTGTVNGIQYVGGVAGKCSHTTISNCYSTADVSGSDYIGGVTGYNNSGSITNCYSSGNVSSTASGTYVGGFSGYIYTTPTFSNCYYLKTDALTGVGQDTEVTGDINAVTADQYAIGEVAYNLLQADSTWGQLIGTDASPVLKGSLVYRTDADYCDGATGGYFYCNEDNTYGTAHYFENGKCTKCGCYRNILDADLIGHSLVLNDKIVVNFYMYLGESVLNDENAYMEFTLSNGLTTKIMVSDVKNSPVTQNGATCYVFPCKVAAKNMATVISAQIIGSNSSSTGVWEYTIKEYADSILDTDSGYDAETKELVESMLDYGTYTEKYFSNDSESTDEPADVNVSDLANYAPSVTASETSGIIYYGSSLILESEVIVRHYFTADETVTEEAIEAAGLTKNGNYYYIDSEGVSVVDFAAQKTCTIAGNTITYCPLSYVRTVLANSDFDENVSLKNVLKSMYHYYMASVAYSNK